MARYIELEGLEFCIAPPPCYEAALEAAGFDHVKLTSRNSWHAELSRHELDFLTGDTAADLKSRHGDEIVDHMAEIWAAMVKVLESGEHCPHHLRDQRPA